MRELCGMVDDDTRPLRAQVTPKRAGDYWVLVPKDDVDVAVINNMGYHVFRQCDGSRSCEEIAKAIATETGDDLDAVRSDVVAFVTRLEGAGLLRTQ